MKVNVTDRQTDGQTTYCRVTALCVASRGKNCGWRRACKVVISIPPKTVAAKLGAIEPWRPLFKSIHFSPITFLSTNSCTRICHFLVEKSKIPHCTRSFVAFGSRPDLTSKLLRSAATGVQALAPKYDNTQL